MSKDGDTERLRRVLIVCTGNLCRSPMAAGLLRQRLTVEGKHDALEIVSAGVLGMEGAAASPQAIAVMAQRGVDIAGHRAQSLKRSHVEEADLILVMEEGHRRSVFGLQPAALGKTFLLSEMAGESGEVDDPYRLRIEDYAACADELDRLVSLGLGEILRRAGISRQEEQGDSASG